MLNEASGMLQLLYNQWAARILRLISNQMRQKLIGSPGKVNAKYVKLPDLTVQDFQHHV